MFVTFVFIFKNVFVFILWSIMCVGMHTCAAVHVYGSEVTAWWVSFHVYVVFRKRMWTLRLAQ